MASVTGYTAARMQEIENAAIIDGEVVAGNLILTRFDTTTINAGSVIGPAGPTGTMPSVDTARVVFPTSSTQSLPNNSPTEITWSTEEYDASGFHSTTVNTGRFTIPSGKAGVYIVSYSLWFAAAATGLAQSWIKKNELSNVYAYGFEGRNDGVVLSSTVTIPLSVGDYVQVMGYHNAGASLNVGNPSGTTTGTSSFTISRIGPL